MGWFIGPRLRAAIDGGKLLAVEQLLENGKNLEIDLENGATPLHYAVMKKREEVVALLIEKGAKVNAANDYGWTPLHRAAFLGQLGIAVRLLKAGADPNLRDGHGKTVHGFAVMRGETEIADLVKPYIKKEIFDLPPPPAPEGPAAAAEPATAPEGETWKKLPGERIARIAVEEAIGYRMTEIFNFAAREKTTLYHNLETRSETVETRGFDELSDKAALEAALAELQKQGGKSDISSISGLDKKKLAPTP